MDTLIGQFKLTDNQISNLATLKNPPFLGGSYNHDTGNYVAVTEKEPSQSDIESLKKTIENLSDTPDKSVYESRFDTRLMLGAMGYAFTGADAVNLSPYLSAIQNYADFKNFKGIKDFIAGLVALNKATPDQVTALYGIFAQQGIDIGSYQ